MRKLAGISMLLLTGAALVGSMASTTSCGPGNEVHNVYSALDGNGDRKRTIFFTDTQTIFCDVDFVGDRKDITVNAVLRQVTSEPCPALYFPNPATCTAGNVLTASWGLPPATVNVVVGVVEQVPGPGATTLAFSWTPQQKADPDAGSNSGDSKPPPPWPVGKYRCEIYVDGQSQGSTSFDIVFPGQDAPHGGGQAYTGQGACPVAPVVPGNPCWDYVVPNQQPCFTNVGKSCSCPQDKGVWVCQ